MLEKMSMLLLAFVIALGIGVYAGQDDKKPNNQAQQRCLKACKDKCAKSYNTCLQNAKTDSAKQQCQRGKEICDSDCVNKACR